MLKKRYIVKVYNPGGTEYLGTLDCDISNFTMSINGGQGEMSLLLPLSFTDFRQGDIVKLNNYYQIYCIDNDTDQDGILIYSGFVNTWNGNMAPDSKISVSLSGWFTRLARSILKSGTTIKLYTNTAAGLSTSGPAQATDVEDVIDEIIDRFNAEVVFPDISKGTILATGNTMTYTFLGSTYLDAIKRCREYAPANWWWYVDENGAFHFKSKPSDPTHLFSFGGNIKNIAVKESMDGIVNRYLLGNNNDLQKLFTDSDSSDKYGDIWLVEVDERITDSTTFNNRGNSKIAELKDPEVVLELEIYDNNYNEVGYDIESVKPGDTCQILNLDENAQIELDANMLIKEVTYYKSYIRVQVQTSRENVGEILRELKEAEDRREQDSLLDTYTT